MPRLLTFNMTKPFWYACWRKFGTISGAPSLIKPLTWPWRLNARSKAMVVYNGQARDTSCRLRPFYTRADLISGRYPVSRPLSLNLTLKVKYQVKCQVTQWTNHGLSKFLNACWGNFGMTSGIPSFDLGADLERQTSGQMPCSFVSCLGRLAAVWDHLGMRADVISGRVNTSSYDLEFDLEGQISGQMSRLYRLPREVRWRLRSFWYQCWRLFGTITGTPAFDLELDLWGQMQGLNVYVNVL